MKPIDQMENCAVMPSVWRQIKERYMKRALLAAMILTLVGTFSAVAALENNGAAQITLEGGTRGEVPFPHHLHQEQLKECDVCHTLFPQEKGSIERYKKEGKLVKKEIMNKHCIKCHRARKRAGEKGGPTICTKCHVKK